MSEIDVPQISGPAAWRGGELLNRADWTRELGPTEVGELLSLAGGVTSGPEGELHVRGTPIETMAPEAFGIPGLSGFLKKVQTDLEEGAGACLIRGFPVAGLSLTQSQGLFRAICSQVGTPLSQSAAGEKVFSVRDAGYREGDPRVRGPNTRKRLSFHTDRCDVIGFLCLQPARTGGENEIVSSATVCNEIGRRRPDLLRLLMQPYCYQRHTVDLGNELPYCHQPIFSWFDGHFAASFLRVLIERAHASPEVPPLTSGQKEALDFLEAVAAEPELHLRFAQAAGDILFMNNWVTMHRRTEFEDFEEPERKRHLLRVWLSVPNSRPLDPAFRANFGATEAGALRGGMKKADPPKARTVG